MPRLALDPLLLLIRRLLSACGACSNLNFSVGKQSANGISLREARNADNNGVDGNKVLNSFILDVLDEESSKVDLKEYHGN